jgi:hypothetical protein
MIVTGAFHAHRTNTMAIHRLAFHEPVFFQLMKGFDHWDWADAQSLAQNAANQSRNRGSSAREDFPPQRLVHLGFKRLKAILRSWYICNFSD